MNTLKLYGAVQMLKNYLQLIDESKYYNEDLIVAVEILENELNGKSTIIIPKVDASTENFIKLIKEASVLELIPNKGLSKLNISEKETEFIFINGESKKYNNENIAYAFGEYWYYEKEQQSVDLKIDEYREYYLYLEMMRRTEVLGFGSGEAFLMNVYHMSYEKAKEITTLWANFRPEIVKELNKLGFLVYKEGLELH